MRIRVLALVAVAVFCLAGRASAQTTTTAAPTTTTAITTTTTTTLAPSALLATCRTMNDWVVVNAPYEASGFCTFTHYATSGMKLTVGDTFADAGQALCASFARKPVNVIFGTGHATTTGYNFLWDSTNRKIWCFTAGSECSNNLDLSGVASVYFRAVCK